MKLKYSITCIILISVVTHQNIDAAYLYQRVKDIYNYRLPSLLAGAGLGTYAYANRYQQDKTYTALALLASGLLLQHACTVSDTSTLEGLIAENTGLFSPYFRDKIQINPQGTLYNLTSLLHQKANNDKTLKKQIKKLHSAIQERFSGKDEKTKRDILDEFFNDPSTIQQKIDAALTQQ